MPQSVATPNLNLATWPTTSHNFNHVELSTNFTRIDEHDHTAGKGVPVGVGGLAAGAVTSGTIGTGAVVTGAIANSNVTDGKLSSPNNTVYRTIYSVYSLINANTSSAGTYSITDGGIYSSIAAIPSPWFLPISPSDYAIPNKTTYCRVKASLATDSTALGLTLTFGLYPVSFSGGSSNLGIVLSFGSVVAGSTAVIATPAINSSVTVNSTDFAIPTGTFMPGVVVSGACPANARAGIALQVQLHHL